ncbi:hypothetical protein D3C71_900980 [compost metagenome]
MSMEESKNTIWFREKFLDILSKTDMSEYNRDLKLANLMTVMEKLFDISMLPHLNEDLDPSILRLYVEISNTRSAG